MFGDTVVMRTFFAACACAVAVVGCPAPADEGEGEPAGEGEGEVLPDCALQVLGSDASTDDRGVLVVLAGEGGAGYVDGNGSDARFNGIGGIARVDKGGVAGFVVSDIFNATLRFVSDDGDVSTLLGFPLDAGAVDGVCGEVRLNGPRGLAVDPRDGSVWFGDGPCLRHADVVTGEVTTVAGNCVSGGFENGALKDARFGFLIHDVEVDAARGFIYVSDRVNDQVRVVDVDGDFVDSLANGFDGPGALAFDGDVLYVADTGHNAIVSIDVDSGDKVVIAGGGDTGNDDGPVATATLNQPQGLALDPSADGDRIVFGGFDGALRAVDLVDASVVTLTTETAGFFAGFANDGDRLLLADNVGGLLVLDGDALTHLAGAVSPEGYVDGAGRDARFTLPDSIIAAPPGVGDENDVLVSDSFNNALRVVDIDSGVVSTFLGGPDKDGDVDGGFDVAEIRFPSGLAASADGNTLFVSSTPTGKVKKIDLVNQTVSTLALIEDCWEIAVDDDNGKLYVVSSTPGEVIEVDIDDGSTRTAASGFSFPIGIVRVDGRTFVTDNPAHVLYEVDVTTGDKTIVLGEVGFQGPSAGPQEAATMSFPSSLFGAIEGDAGNEQAVVYVAETGGQVVRRLLLSDFSSTFVAGDSQLSGALPAGAQVQLDGAPLLNPQDVVVIGSDVVIAGDTTVVVARP